MNAQKRKCEKSIREPGKWPHFTRCTNNAKVERDGKWYCGIHDPERIREKRRARGKIEKERWKKMEEVSKRRSAEKHYCQNLDTEYLETHTGEK